MDNVLQVRGLAKSFPGVQALYDVRLDVEEGTVHAVMGENGAGKSTLMKPYEKEVLLPYKLVTRENIDEYLK